MTSRTREQIDRAWDVHKDADALFYNHVNAFILAHTFLVAGFVVVFVDSGGDVRSRLLAISICVLALFVTWVMGDRLRVAIRRLWFLKQRYLIEDDVYQNYITGDASREFLALDARRAEFHKNKYRYHELAHQLPLALAVFWIFAAILEGSFFLIPEAHAK